MYYVQTRSPLQSVKGRIALTASQVLTFIDQARRAGLEVDVTDADGRPVPADQIRREAGANDLGCLSSGTDCQSLSRS